MFFIKPELRLEILKEIIFDAFENNTNVSRVGLVGSFSRNDFNYNSDVDLVLDCSYETSNSLKVLDAMEYIRRVLVQQFIRDADFIYYPDILEGTKRSDYRKEGYLQMLNDIKWIYERRAGNDQR